MQGFGTDEFNLTKIIVLRSEIDMVQIKIEYQKEFNKNLADEIIGDTVSNFKNL